MKKFLLPIALMSIFGLAACESNDSVAENAGEKIDEAYSDAANAVEDTCEDAKEGMNMEDQDC